MSIEEIIELLDNLDGYGIIFTDEDDVVERLIELGFNE